MSLFQRQREALKSGFVKQAVVVSMMANTPQSTILAIPGLGNPMEDAGTQRDAPSQWISLWAGIRPIEDFNPFDVVGTVNVFVEAGLIPYLDKRVPTLRSARPLFVPLQDNFGLVQGNIPNILGQRALLPWPPGALVVRITFDWQMQNMLGSEVDLVAAWTVCSIPNWHALPARDDSIDL